MSANKPLTQEQLDAIRERVEVATDGPWVEGQRCVFTEDYEHAIVSDSLVEAPGMTPYGEAVQNPADVALIANAPEDLTDLLAEVERLRALTTVDDAMVERAAHAIAAHWYDMHTNESLGRQEVLAIAALEAAFNPREEA